MIKQKNVVRIHMDLTVPGGDGGTFASFINQYFTGGRFLTDIQACARWWYENVEECPEISMPRINTTMLGECSIALDASDIDFLIRHLGSAAVALGIPARKTPGELMKFELMRLKSHIQDQFEEMDIPKE